MRWKEKWGKVCGAVSSNAIYICALTVLRCASMDCVENSISVVVGGSVRVGGHKEWG